MLFKIHIFSIASDLVVNPTECEEAFLKAKEALASATLLVHSDESNKVGITLMTDASNVAIGSVLLQYRNGSLQPIAFFFKKLSLAESRYSTFDRELLVIYLSIKPITRAINSATEKTPRQEGHFISQFTSDIQHVSGKKNVVADFLSGI